MSKSKNINKTLKPTDKQPTRIRKPTHPGEFLREIVLPGAELSVSETARLLGISRQNLQSILAAERPVTPPTAVRLGALFDTTPESWLNMQAAHDVWKTQKTLRAEVRQIGTTGHREILNRVANIEQSRAAHA